MDDDTMLPEDDRDLSLARRLGARLEARAPFDDAGATPDDDALVRALLAFKQEESEATPPAEASERVWVRLEERLPDRPGRARLYALRPARTWIAVAASVLLLVGLGWLLLRTGQPEPVLLASAGADIVAYTVPGDGSVVTLRPHSRLYDLASGAGQTRLRLVGEGFFDVVKNEARVFAVEAGGALVHVLGTRFDVSTWGGQTTVYLQEGRVRFENLRAKGSVVLTPGQRSVATADGKLLPPDDVPEDEYTDWLRRETIFSQRPLRLILAELEHHYAVRFDVPAALLDETLSGRILLVDQAQSIEDLAVVMGGRFVQVDDTTYRFVPN